MTQEGKGKEREFTRIDEIAEVRGGLTMRGREASRQTAESGLHLLRISDLTEWGKIVVRRNFGIVASPAVTERYRLRPGDVVLANRGARLTAALVPGNLRAVASGQLFTLRVFGERVVPEYLHWFLNLKRTQEYLQSLAKGGPVRALSLEVFKRELRVPVPGRHVQWKVVELARMVDEERTMAKRLAALRQRYMDSAMLSIVNNEMGG